MMRKILACTLVMNMTWTTAWTAGPIFAAESISTDPVVAPPIDYEPSLQGIQEFRATIDRSEFDPETLLEKLDYEKEPILDFVKTDIRFELYEGLLRGAAGTLMSQAGNSLDQAVLLATLLKDAGFEARIHRTSLTPEQSHALLGQLTLPTPSPQALRAHRPTKSPPQSDTATVIPEEEDFDIFESQDSTFAMPASEIVTSAVERISSTLEENGLAIGDQSLTQNLARQAQDYFWIEHRDGPTSPWEAAHPAFSSINDELMGLTPLVTFEDTIPEELQHRVRIEAFIEQKTGNSLAVHPIMDPWERPAANLMGKSLTYGNYPSGATEETLQTGWDAVLNETNLFIPTINGRRPEGAKAFDRNGIVFGLDSAGLDRFSATALFQTVGGKAEDAAGALDALGSKEKSEGEDLMTLTAQWLEYSLIAPGGATTTYRRPVMDRLGPAARGAGDLSKLQPESHFRSLIAARVLMVNVGAFPMGFGQDQLLSNFEIDMKIKLRSQEPRQLEYSPNEIPVSAPLLAAYLAFDSDPGHPEDVLSYRDEPGLLVRGAALSAESGKRMNEFVDIIHNSRQYLRVDATPPRMDPAAAIRQGVWETFTEGIAVTGDHKSNEIFDTRKYFERAEQEDIAFKLLQPGQPSLGADQVEPDVVAQIMRELANGYAVLIPESRPSEPSRVAWWRVDPKTGEVLGIVDGVGGAVATSYLVVLAVALVALVVLAGAEVYTMTEEWQECEKEARSEDIPNLAEEDAYVCGCRIKKRTRRYSGWAANWKWCDASEAIFHAGCMDALGCASTQGLTGHGQYRNLGTRSEKCVAIYENELRKKDALKNCRPAG